MPSNPRTSGASEPSAESNAPESPKALATTASPSVGNVSDIKAVMDNDPADTTVKIEPEISEDDDKSPRIRAIPYENGSTIRVSRKDFADNGVTYHDIEFDFRRNDMTLKVVEEEKENEFGVHDPEVIHKDVADWLTRKFPTQFEYVNQTPAEENKA